LRSVSVPFLSKFASETFRNRICVSADRIRWSALACACDCLEFTNPILQPLSRDIIQVYVSSHHRAAIPILWDTFPNLETSFTDENRTLKCRSSFLLGPPKCNLLYHCTTCFVCGLLCTIGYARLETLGSVVRGGGCTGTFIGSVNMTVLRIF